MVVKLVGSIEGQEIVFSRKEGDIWETSIPSSENGVYILELTAVDEAGNTSFIAKYVVTIDTTALRVTLEPFPWDSEVVLSDYFACCYLSDYFSHCCLSDYFAYCCEEEEGEVERMRRVIVFDYGENRHVKLRVTSCKDESFVIKNASYELVRSDTQEVEIQGNATILENILDVVICPQNVGYYELKYTYSIADETLVDVVEISVREN